MQRAVRCMHGVDTEEDRPADDGDAEDGGDGNAAGLVVVRVGGDQEHWVGEG